MSSSQTVVITGAAGFIGSHAASAFIQKGYRVVGIDNFCDFYERRFKELNVQAVGEGLDIEEADIRDASAMQRIIGNVRPVGIVHLAAMAGVRPSIERPAYYAQVNVEGTVNLLDAAVKAGVSRFLFASSSSVYGNCPSVPFSETMDVNEPISPYAATKRAGELLCHTYWHLHQLPVFCLRFFTVYGPRQRPDLAIHKFTRLIDRGESIPVFGDGSTSRDYTYVQDICAGIQLAFDKCDRYRIYNLGGNDPVTLARLIEGIENAVGRKANIDRRPMQPGDVERTYADLTRSTQELGYKPEVSIDDGLERFAAWYREHGATYHRD